MSLRVQFIQPELWGQHGPPQRGVKASCNEQRFVPLKQGCSPSPWPPQRGFGTPSFLCGLFIRSWQ